MSSFNFFLGVVSEIEVQSFSIFPTWLPNHVTYDVIIIIKTFHMSSQTYGENFVSIGLSVPEKMIFKAKKSAKYGGKRKKIRNQK